MRIPFQYVFSDTRYQIFVVFSDNYCSEKTEKLCKGISPDPVTVKLCYFLMTTFYKILEKYSDARWDFSCVIKP